MSSLRFGNMWVRNLLHLSGPRAKKREPAPCKCGAMFFLFPWQDLPKHRCSSRK